MIRFVSSSRSSPFNSTGLPIRIVISGGFVTLSMFGSRALRGHTRSVPHMPTGMTGAPRHVREPGRAPSSLQLRVEERLAARDRALAASAPRPRRRAARRRPRATARPSPCRGRRGCRRTPSTIWPTTGTSNTSFLPRKRTGRPRCASAMPHRHRVEVAAVVADDDRRARLGEVLHAARCRTARTGSAAGCAAAIATCCGSTPSTFGTPLGTSRLTIGQRCDRGADHQPRDRGSPRTDGRRPTATARRTSCRSTRTSQAAKRRAHRPTPSPRRACPCPTRTRRGSCRRSGRRARRSASRRRRRGRARRPAA